VGLEAGEFKYGNGGKTSGDEAMTKHLEIILDDRTEPEHTYKYSN
jgi:hypothetical protein